MELDFTEAFAAHRPALLRHCYRMLGSFAEAEDLVQETLERAWKARDSYRGSAPIEHWLYSIATNGCLNALAQRKRRALPQIESGPAGESYVLGELEASSWITPAADARLFPTPVESAESRETVTLAFTALLQRLPPKQRAALLMKDVLGWPADEIAGTLGLSLSSVNSAIHRGRQSVAQPPAVHDEPSAATLAAFVRAWEERDLDALVALLREDVTLAMPPHAVWFHGRDAVVRFLGTPRFSAYWSSVVGLAPTRANGMPAFAFYREPEPDLPARHSIMVAHFAGERAVEMTVFIGTPYFLGFDLPETFDRTVSRPPFVMTDKGDRS